MVTMTFSAIKAFPFQVLNRTLRDKIGLNYQSTERDLLQACLATLKSLSSHLFDCLQCPYWERENWKILKPNIELAHCLSGYCTYLQKSNKRMYSITQAHHLFERLLIISHSNFSLGVLLIAVVLS